MNVGPKIIKYMNHHKKVTTLYIFLKTEKKNSIFTQNRNLLISNC